MNKYIIALAFVAASTVLVNAEINEITDIVTTEEIKALVVEKVAPEVSVAVEAAEQA